VKRQAQGKNMKIYLLMVLIGTLLSAIHCLLGSLLIEQMVG
jgi:hypothetical protein